MSVPVETADVGRLLRGWRERRRYSQQELSDISTVSTRHLSRVETGKARPTTEMLIHLADHLDIPVRDRNTLLLAGGFAPRYVQRQPDDVSIAIVMDGLRNLLDAHLPYPALLLDDNWDVVDANAGVDMLLAGCAAELLDPPVNVIQLCMHEDGLAARIVNFDQWAAHPHLQLQRRADRTQSPRLQSLAGDVARFRTGARHTMPRLGPVLTLQLTSDNGILSFFSTSAQLTTATDATLEGLHLETFLPADEHTRAQFV